MGRRDDDATSGQIPRAPLVIKRGSGQGAVCRLLGKLRQVDDPVLAVANGIYETEEGLMRSGTAHKLLGIFSSMPMASRPA